MKIEELHKDASDGAQLTVSTDGATATRVLFVTLEETDTQPAQDRLWVAARAVLSQYPIGSPYPGTNLPLDTLQVIPAGTSSGPIRAELTYQLPRYSTSLPDESGEPRLEIGGTVQMETTQYFIEEVPFTAEEQNTLFNTAHQITLTHEGDTEGGEVEFPKVMRIMRYSRRESRENALAHANLLGTLNNAEWLDAAKHTVLCTQALGTSNDGVTFEMHYEFQHKPNKWYAVIPYRDRETGDIPAELTPNEGIRRFRVIPEADYGLLGF